jgi:hypothetical protein
VAIFTPLKPASNEMGELSIDRIFVAAGRRFPAKFVARKSALTARIAMIEQADRAHFFFFLNYHPFIDNKEI